MFYFEYSRVLHELVDVLIGAASIEVQGLCVSLKLHFALMPNQVADRLFLVVSPYDVPEARRHIRDAKRIGFPYRVGVRDYVISNSRHGPIIERASHFKVAREDVPKAVEIDRRAERINELWISVLEEDVGIDDPPILRIETPSDPLKAMLSHVSAEVDGRDAVAVDVLPRDVPTVRFDNFLDFFFHISICSVYNHIIDNNGFICNITGRFPSRAISGIVDGGSDRISVKRFFLHLEPRI